MKEAESERHGYFLSVTPRSLVAVSEGQLLAFSVIRGAPQRDGTTRWPPKKKRPELDVLRDHGARCCLLMLVPCPQWHSFVVPLSSSLWESLEDDPDKIEQFILLSDETLVTKALSYYERSGSEELTKSFGAGLQAALGKDHVTLGQAGPNGAFQASIPLPYGARQILGGIRSVLGV